MSASMTEATPCRIVVLISGNGSNLQALMDRCDRQRCKFVGVLSNRADAYGLQRASGAGVPTHVIDHRDYPDRESFDRAMMAVIDAFDADLVVLAGFMRILSAAFVQRYQGRLLNIHPSLLPAYKGTHTHRRVLDAGEAEHGVSVHFVTEELDGGPVIRQAVLAVNADDTSESLAARVAIEEHKIYPEVVDWFASGRLQMRDGKAWLDGTMLPVTGHRSHAGSVADSCQ